MYVSRNLNTVKNKKLLNLFCRIVLFTGHLFKVQRWGKALFNQNHIKEFSILQNLRKDFIQRRLDIQENCKFFIAKTHIHRKQLPGVLQLKKEGFKRKHSEVKNYAKVVTN